MPTITTSGRSGSILGVGGLDHNASISVIEAGRVTAFLELERLDRRKNAGLDGVDALERLCERLGVSDVAHVALTDRTFEPQRPWLVPWLRRRFPAATLSVHEHHACHLAAAFYTSGWPAAAVLSLDGKGDGLSAAGGLGTHDHDLKILLRVPSAHSIGRLWWAASVCCGLGDHYAAGKTMAWAALGRPSILPALRACLTLADDGGFRLHHPDDPTRFRRVPALAAWLAGLDPAPQPGAGPRYPDVAASVQILTEEIVLHMARHLCERTGSRRLALAGGVALNGLANERLLAEGVVDALHVPPVPDDRGLSLGAAALAAAAIAAPLRVDPDGLSPFLGPTPAPLASAPRSDFIEHPADDLVGEVAERLARGELVAWFEGRDEAGPRALGGRSILASPTRAAVRDHLNAVVKGREPFRPFGCSISLAAVDDWLDMRGASPFMLRIVPVLTQRRAEIPAVVHLDGTTRPHTVTPTNHPRLDRLLGRLADVGHPPVLLNTSLNRRGEPIAHTAAEAITIAAHGGLDAVVLDDHLLVRSSSGNTPTSSGR